MIKTLVYLETEFLLFHSFFPKEDDAQDSVAEVCFPGTQDGSDFICIICACYKYLFSRKSWKHGGYFVLESGYAGF